MRMIEERSLNSPQCATSIQLLPTTGSTNTPAVSNEVRQLVHFTIDDLLPSLGHPMLSLQDEIINSVKGRCKYVSKTAIKLPETTHAKVIVPFLFLGPLRISKLNHISIQILVEWNMQECKPKVVYHAEKSELLHQVPSAFLQIGKKATITFDFHPNKKEPYEQTLASINDAQKFSIEHAYFGLLPENDLLPGCQFNIFGFQQVDELQNVDEQCPFYVRLIEA